jgi:hypothetical protein
MNHFNEGLFQTYHNTHALPHVQGATKFMCAKLNFPDAATAKALRDKYFVKCHSTVKALTVAEENGDLPSPPEGWPEGKKYFDPNDLSEWWAEHLNFGLLGGKDEDLVEIMESCPLNMVAVSVEIILHSLLLHSDLYLGAANHTLDKVTHSYNAY